MTDSEGSHLSVVRSQVTISQPVQEARCSQRRKRHLAVVLSRHVQECVAEGVRDGRLDGAAREHLPHLLVPVVAHLSIAGGTRKGKQQMRAVSFGVAGNVARKEIWALVRSG